MVCALILRSPQQAHAMRPYAENTNTAALKRAFYKTRFSALQGRSSLDHNLPPHDNKRGLHEGQLSSPFSCNSHLIHQLLAQCPACLQKQLSPPTNLCGIVGGLSFIRLRSEALYVACC
jgi:hypothetical protein